MWKLRGVEKSTSEPIAYESTGGDFSDKGVSCQEKGVFERWQLISCV